MIFLLNPKQRIFFCVWYQIKDSKINWINDLVHGCGIWCTSDISVIALSHWNHFPLQSQVNNKVNTDELEAELSFQERDYMAREGQMKSHLEEVRARTVLSCKKLQSSAVITRSNIVRYYINDYRNWGRISTRCWIHKKNTAYLTLTGELWGVFCKYLWENWPRYNGTALYYQMVNGDAADGDGDCDDDCGDDCSDHHHYQS